MVLCVCVWACTYYHTLMSVFRRNGALLVSVNCASNNKGCVCVSQYKGEEEEERPDRVNQNQRPMMRLSLEAR